MAWLDTTDAPKVETAKREVRSYFYDLANGKFYHRDSTIIEYEKRGMTNTAANTYLTAQAASNHNPQKVPVGGGGYNVRTAEDTYGAWET